MEERHRIRLRDDLSLNRVWLLLKTLMAIEFQELTSKELRTVESKAWYESFFYTASAMLPHWKHRTIFLLSCILSGFRL